MTWLESMEFVEYYQKALERMLEKPVEEKYIYSVNLERAFAVE